MTYVFDTSALLRFFDGEEGLVVIRDIFRQAAARKCKMEISAVNWGELVHQMHKRSMPARAEERLKWLQSNQLVIVPATAARAKASGLIKLKFGIGYADCFGVELASDSPEHILVTGDYGVKPAESVVQIKFLPTKTTPYQ